MVDDGAGDGAAVLDWKQLIKLSSQLFSQQIIRQVVHWAVSLSDIGSTSSCALSPSTSLDQQKQKFDMLQRREEEQVVGLSTQSTVCNRP